MKFERNMKSEKGEKPGLRENLDMYFEVFGRRV